LYGASARALYSPKRRLSGPGSPADEAQRVGAAYRLGRLARAETAHGGGGNPTAVSVLLEALAGHSGGAATAALATGDTTILQCHCLPLAGNPSGFTH
jgi:hypothetical protein